MPHFTLTVATSADGFIARAHDDAPQNWASSEEQALFFRDVEAADWAIMGRHTHEAADKPHRKRIVFSTTISGWQRPTQLWLDPKGIASADNLPALVEEVQPLERGLILGGTRVHDWFLAKGAIDRVHLTIEPVIFERGLPIFSEQVGNDPLQAIEEKGFIVRFNEILNARGTQYFVLERS